MQILAPLNNLSNLERFISLGADEFYLGYEDKEWDRTFGKYNELNKMSSIKGSDIAEWSELPCVINQVKNTGKACYIAINGFSYTDSQIDFFEKRFEKLAEMNIDGVILGAPELFSIANKYGIAIHASSMTNCYNDFLVKHYQELGAKRIIFPRDISISNIKELRRLTPNIEFEVFLMRVGCRYSDPNCLCLHGGKHGGICGYLNRAKRILYSSKTGFQETHDYSLNNELYERMFHVLPACGLCAIFDFVKMGIDACKIVGRYENDDEVAEDIRLVSNNITIAKACNTKEEFLSRMITHTIHTTRCYMSMGCYYPEARF